MNLNRLSKKLAELTTYSDHTQHRMSCVIVDKNRIISEGYNQIKTDVKSNHPYKSTHAELDAIVDAKNKDIKGCTAYVYRMNRNGELSNAKPCPSCENLLKLAGIRKVYFTNNNSWDEMVIA